MHCWRRDSASGSGDINAIAWRPLVNENEKIHTPPPVQGYKPLSQRKIDEVNINKQLEETVLRRLDDLARLHGERFVDERWLKIGRTHIEQAFMAINRAIFQPERIKLESDS